MAGGVAIGLGTAAAVVGSLVVAWHALTWWEVDKKCEKPKYALVKTLGSKKDWLGRGRPLVEVRRYAPYLMAEVVVEGGEMRDALSSGFRQIAGFIFGKNQAPGAAAGEAAKVAMTSPVALEMAQPAGPSQKIAMTAPVAAEMVAGGEAPSYKISFIMPSQYTMATLPQPLNPNVELKEMPSRTMAALTWKGGSPKGTPAVEERAALLRLTLAEAGLQPCGNLCLWQYHPPFAPAWMRVNEVLYELEDSPEVATL